MKKLLMLVVLLLMILTGCQEKKEVTLTLDEFKKLTSKTEVKSNLPRQRREGRSKIETEDKKTTPSTAANCKRRSRF